mgnify:CR=1 FL=1
MFLLYQRDVTGLPIAELEGNAERDRARVLDAYTRAMVTGVLDELESIDAAIAKAASGWSVDRIAPLERNVLRVAIHEMTSRDDIPGAVAIDEAVETAKRYCQAEAGAFVNGILGAVAQEIGSAAS